MHNLKLLLTLLASLILQISDHFKNYVDIYLTDLQSGQ